MKIKKVPVDKNEYQYQFMCPGCEQEHAFNDTWQFNGDYNKPTIHPSFLMRGGRFKNGTKETENFVCHSFIKDGKIQFLADCTHGLAGKTVDLLDIE